VKDHLWPLLDIKGNSDKELKEKYRDIFISTYVKTPSGDKVIITDWNGNRIHFSLFSFDHAFSEATDYRFGNGLHDKPFSYKRAHRVLWIKEVLAASAGTVERRHQIRKDSRGRPKKRRVLIVVEEKYIVVLEETEKGKVLNFISAFPAETSYLEKIRRESVLIEIKNPSLNGD
jgi:hypothetical protein